MNKINNKNYKSLVAKRVRELREENGYTQAFVGKGIGMSTPYISTIERQVAEPGITELCNLARLFGLHPIELLTGIPGDTCEIAEKLAEMEPNKRTCAIKLFQALIELVNLPNS